MTEVELRQLLHRAVESAEASAPPVDPLTALARGRRRHEQRRGQLVAVAFVASTVLLQLLPAEAFAVNTPAGAASVAAHGSPPSGTAVPRG